MPQQPRLTLAVIVKNEGKLLGELLKHHRGLYDEAVIVDTGSVDSSKEVARREGARVYDFSWIDNFSAARNYALSQARGTWILQLDCDECIDPRHFADLRSIIQKPADHCLALPVNNYTAKILAGDWNEVQATDLKWCHGAPGYLRTYPIRLFPNNPRLRYAGIIHENLSESLQYLDFPQVKGLATIHHTGLLEPEGLRRRDALYENLLKEKVRQAPWDLSGLTELARFLVGKGQLELAEKILEKGLTRENSPGEHAQANLLMVEIQAHLGKLTPALQRLETTIHCHPDQLKCWVLASTLFLTRGEKNKAKTYLDFGRKLFPLSPVLKQLETKV